MKKNDLRGSYTVEAAAVVCITVLVLAALIICTFYIHDRAVFQGAACEAAAAGSNFMTDAERKAAAAAVKKKITASRFLGSRNLSGSVATGQKEVRAIWTAAYPVPGFAARYLSGGRLDIQKAWTCRIFDPADAIRKIRGVGELLTGGEK